MFQTDVKGFLDYIEELKEATPIVWWRAVCYHYLRKTRHVTR